MDCLSCHKRTDQGVTCSFCGAVNTCDWCGKACEEPFCSTKCYDRYRIEEFITDIDWGN